MGRQFLKRKGTIYTEAINSFTIFYPISITAPLREKCPYSEFFFFRIFPHANVLCIQSCSWSCDLSLSDIFRNITEWLLLLTAYTEVLLTKNNIPMNLQNNPARY